MAAILTAIGAVAVALAGCGSSSSGASTLSAAMAQAADGSASTTYFEFGNVARLRALGATGATGSTSTYAQLYGVGFSQLGGASASLQTKLGYSPGLATTAVSIGMAPHTALRLNGKVDSSAVETKLRALGARPRSFGGTPGLTFAADDQIDLNGPFASLGILTGLNQVVVKSGVFAGGSDATTLEQVEAPGAHSLGSDARFASLAKCLGSSVAAVVATTDLSGAPVQGVAVSVRDPGTSSVATDVLCALPRAGQSAAVRNALGVRTRTDIVSDQPMTAIAQSVTMDAVGPALRATFVLRSGERADYLLRALQENEIGYWLGGAQTGAK